jgi:hypothetical protein
MAIHLETISGVDFEVYGGVTAISNYLLGSSTAGAAAFRRLASDDQKRRLIDATRYIDEQRWQGAATGLAGGTATSLQFPRTGLTDLAGASLDAANVPAALLAAVSEMAAVLAVDVEAASAVDAGSNVQSLGAGPASLSFFRPTSAQNGTASTMPVVVNRLIGRWLASSVSGLAGGVITGTSSPCSDNFGPRSGRTVWWPL